MIFWLLLVFLGIRDFGSQADCNVCSSAFNAACISATQFRFCEDNVPVDPINSCPPNKYCTGNTNLCQSNETLKACNRCGICKDQIFACTGVHTFSLCLGTDTPQSISASCGPDYVCNSDNPNICSNALLGSQPTCPTIYGTSRSDSFLPGADINLDPNEYCRNLQTAGRFPYGNDTATLCSQYVTCSQIGDTWYGAAYTCPGSTFFQIALQRCNNSIPAYCPS